MELIKNSISIDTFPFKESLHITDLLYVDVPMLSLFKYKNIFYIKYLVDDENSVDTYLFYKITSKSLAKFLNGKITLLDTINKIEEHIYIYDEDEFGDVVKTIMVKSEDIIESYLPEHNSFFNLSFDFDNVPELKKILDSYSVAEHTRSLRKNAIYLKFSSKSARNGDTVPLENIIKSLPKLQQSFKNYTKALFENTHKEIITDLNKFKTTLNKVISLSEMRIVDLKFSSFEIALNIDEVMINDPNTKPDIIDFAKKIPSKFENEVLNYDSENEELNKIINDQFNNEQKAEIYKPIIDVTSDKKLNFSIKAKNNNNFKKITYDRFIKLDEIIANVNENKKAKVENEYEMIQVTAMVPKGKSTSSIKIENNLFSHVNEVLHKITAEDFISKGYKYKPENDITVTIKDDNGVLEYSSLVMNEHINYQSKDTNIKAGLEKLTEKIYQFIVENDRI